MSLPTLPASTIILSPLKTVGLLLGSIVVTIVITGCSSAEPEKSETEKQVSSAAVASSEDQKAAVSSNKPESTTAEAVQATTTPSPTETFIKMSFEIQKIKTYGDYEAFVSKYMTKKGLAVFQTQSSALSEEEKVQEISKIKAYIQASEKITNNIQEDINGSTATLTAPSRDGEDFELITLELENNQWKVSPDDFRRLVEFSL